MTYPTLTDEMRMAVANLAQRPWIQGAMQDGDAVCAHGAVMTCRGLRPGDAHIIRAVMRARGLAEKWNDADGRTKDEVLERMSTIGVSDADLAATFGPGWGLVVAVIRRAAILTVDEARRLAAAWAAAGAAARDAAWDAARAAARDAARAAAWAAAGAAAWDAARDAAWAAVVSDLVGQHGLTPTHYDTLMQPWIDVLGDDWAAEGLMG